MTEFAFDGGGKGGGREWPGPDPDSFLVPAAASARSPLACGELSGPAAEKAYAAARSNPDGIWTVELEAAGVRRGPAAARPAGLLPEAQCEGCCGVVAATSFTLANFCRDRTARRSRSVPSSSARRTGRAGCRPEPLGQPQRLRRGGGQGRPWRRPHRAPSPLGTRRGPDLGEVAADIRLGQLGLAGLEEALGRRVELVRAEFGRLHQPAQAAPWPPRGPVRPGPARPAPARRHSDRGPGPPRSGSDPGRGPPAAARSASPARDPAPRPAAAARPSNQPPEQARRRWCSAPAAERRPAADPSPVRRRAAGRRRPRHPGQPGRALRHRRVRAGQLVGGKPEQRHRR